MGTNLHSVWDYYILGTAGFGADRKAVAPYADRLGALPWPPVTEAGHSAPEAWAGESCRLVDARGDRKSVGEGKSVSVRVDLGGRRILKKKTPQQLIQINRIIILKTKKIKKN